MQSHHAHSHTGMNPSASSSAHSGRKRLEVAGLPSEAAPQRASPRALSGEAAGSLMASSLAGCREGELVRFSRPVSVAGREFASALVVREFKTASKAVMLQLRPATTCAGGSAAAGGSALFIFKFEDVRAEHALMCALHKMNQRWRRHHLTAFGQPVEALAYTIIPLGSQVGLVEVVPDSRTLRELASGVPFGERHLRVVRALQAAPRRLDRLAATTVAVLTAGYALGIRDGHDDNIMLCANGTLFRIDLGFAFGRMPEIDAPCTFVPNAVHFALGEQRWDEVVSLCGRALLALGSADEAQRFREPPAWDLLKSIPELRPLLPQAHVYVRTLSFEHFGKQVREADEWSLSRATKNTLREAVRYVMAETDVEAKPAPSSRSGSWWTSFDPFNLLAGGDPEESSDGGSTRATASAAAPSEQRLPQSAPLPRRSAQQLAPGGYPMAVSAPSLGASSGRAVKAAPLVAASRRPK